jgi:hypothetical protein
MLMMLITGISVKLGTLMILKTGISVKLGTLMMLKTGISVNQQRSISVDADIQNISDKP